MTVPADASMIFHLEEPFEQWSDITSNKIWNYLKTNPYFSELGNDIDSINLEMESNPTLWELVIGRPMVISVHQTRPNDYDFLYTIDLQRSAQFEFIKDYIKDLRDDIHKVFSRTYHGQEIIEFAFDDSPTTYYLSIRENLLIISSTHTLVEQSIDQIDEPVLIRDLDFIDVSKQMGGDGIKMYIQYDHLTQFLKQFMSPGEEAELGMLNPLKYSGLTMDATDEYISITGFSSIKKNGPNLLTALINSGEGEVEAGTIVPDNASYFMSLGFDDAERFYKQMEKVLMEEEDGEDYIKSKEKVEKYLKISIKDNFLSWMDNEIALIQLNSNSDKNKVELAVAIKHSDAGDAKKNLDFIKEQIRKKTPVKFRGVNYKDHEIHYLSIKGFFKLMFGKAFADIDKPYYTIMEDYVVFSNSPKTLGKIITAVQENHTLDNTQEYAHLMENFAIESNLFIYLSAEEVLNDAQRILDKESWKDLTPHKVYIKSFPMSAFQFTTKGELLRHQLQMNYLNHEQINGWIKLVEESNFIEDKELESEEASEDDIISIENILPEDFNSKTLSEEYPNGQMKFEVSLKDGLKHGRYYHYDSVGNMIVKGRYKDDKKTGVWKTYNSEGERLTRERY